MPEHLKALLVILALATGVFFAARGAASAMAIAVDDFRRRRNLWTCITLVAFLSHNFWVYIVVTATLLPLFFRKERNTLAGFYFVLFAVPTLSGQISGLGIVNQFFTIDYVRLLALAVLLPAFLSLVKQPGIEKFGNLFPDKLIVGYLALQCVLVFSASSFTNTLRVGLFYAFIDVFLPYYIASRSIRDVAAFRDALMSFVMAALVLATIGAYEFSRQWLLYVPLQNAFDIKVLVQAYLGRGESLRAMGSAGHAIPMGYIMAVALGFLMYLKLSVANVRIWLLALLVLAVGLLVPVSRGPWVGFAAMMLTFAALAPTPGKTLLRIGFVSLLALPLLAITPAGDYILERLPFIGTSDTESITYRQRLLEVCINIVLQNPFFGAFDYFYSAEIQELKQGQGIIDIVNTYLGIALGSGLVGLSLFVGFFISAAAGVFKGMRRLRDKRSELYQLGRVLVAVMVGIQIIIFTVSSISFIPVIYWSVAGLGVAYARMLATRRAETATVPAMGVHRLGLVAVNMNRQLGGSSDTPMTVNAADRGISKT